MRTITVSCRKTDPLAFGVQKYDNADDWNVRGGRAPNGVSATRYLRKTQPATELLSPLAAWLVNHVPDCVAGKMPHPQSRFRVRCFSANTEADLLRREFASGWRNNPALSSDENVRRAENMIRIYGESMNQPAQISDWLFDQIEPNQDDTEYWNAQAKKMQLAGVVRVRIGDTTWDANRE